MIRKEIQKLVASGEYRKYYPFEVGPDGALASPTIPAPPAKLVGATSAYAYDTIQEAEEIFSGTREGNSYSRISAHPRVREFEQQFLEAEFKGAPEKMVEWDAVAASSGMAIIKLTTDTLLAQDPNRKIVVSDPRIYGGTRDYFVNGLPAGCTCHFVKDPDSLDSWAEALAECRDCAAMVFLESVTNPSCAIPPAIEISRWAKNFRIPLAMDNTVPTPECLQPLVSGLADITLHSVSKFVLGNSTGLAGIAVAKSDLVAQINKRNRIYGAILDPGRAWMAQLGLATLSLRMPIVHRNMAKATRALRSCRRIEKIHSPYLPGPYTDIRETLESRCGMRGSGPLIAFEIEGNASHAEQFMNGLSAMHKKGKRAPIAATHLGDCKTIATLPWRTTHLSFPEREKRRFMSPTLIRLSVGIEPENMFEEVGENMLTLLESLY